MLRIILLPAAARACPRRGSLPQVSWQEKICDPAEKPAGSRGGEHSIRQKQRGVIERLWRPGDTEELPCFGLVI